MDILVVGFVVIFRGMMGNFFGSHHNVMCFLNLIWKILKIQALKLASLPRAPYFMFVISFRYI